MLPLLPIIGILAQAGLPWLARQLGGTEAEQVAQKVVPVLASLTGQNEPDQIAAALSQKPELLAQVRIRLAELDLEARKLELDQFRANLDHEKDMASQEAADRASARTRDTAIRQAGATNSRADAMVWLAAIGAIGSMVLLIFGEKIGVPLSAETRTMISTTAAAFMLCLRDAFNFEFGSSRGSADKASAIESQLARTTAALAQSRPAGPVEASGGPTGPGAAGPPIRASLSEADRLNDAQLRQARPAQ